MKIHGYVAEALVRHGHEAHILVASNNKPSDDLDPNVRTFFYLVNDTEPWVNTEDYANLEWNFMEENLIVQLIWAFFHVPHVKWRLNQDCEYLFDDINLLEKLKSTKYDLTLSNFLCL